MGGALSNKMQRFFVQITSKNKIWCKNREQIVFFSIVQLIVTYRQQEVERLRGERNVVANKMKGKLEPAERQRLIEEGIWWEYYIMHISSP